MTERTAAGAASLVGMDDARRILNYANKSSVSRLVADGKLTPALKVGNAYLFRRRDVERIANKRGAA